MLDDAARAVVFARDGYCCVKCGNREYLQWAHVYSRRYLSLRWAIGNAMTLCGGCHMAWHHNPLDAVTWWVSKYGEQAHAQLRHTLSSKGKIDRRLTLMWLQQELKRYQRERPEDASLGARTG
jgi:5-methylcytosine-specific restriction endonuclease McrA